MEINYLKIHFLSFPTDFQIVWLRLTRITSSGKGGPIQYQ